MHVLNLLGLYYLSKYLLRVSSRSAVIQLIRCQSFGIKTFCTVKCKIPTSGKIIFSFISLCIGLYVSTF
jgi:hypothetical protein